MDRVIRRHETSHTQTKPVPFPGQVIAIFNYRFMSRNGAGLWVAGWLLGIVIWLIYFFISLQNNPVNTHDKLFAATLFCSVILLIVLISLWGWHQTRTFMQPVVITDQGIAGDLRPERPRFRAVANPGCIEFDSITEVAMLAKPDIDADSRRWGVSRSVFSLPVRRSSSGRLFRTLIAYVPSSSPR